jgi:hypothetical protein
VERMWTAVSGLASYLCEQVTPTSPTPPAGNHPRFVAWTPYPGDTVVIVPFLTVNARARSNHLAAGSDETHILALAWRAASSDIVRRWKLGLAGLTCSCDGVQEIKPSFPCPA